MAFREISPYDLPDNLFTRIGKDWMLITAGDSEAHNSMTASWGQTGFLWNRPVATVYVRPQRYTYEFMEKNDRYSLSFFAPGEQRKALNLMGSKSGRDIDKLAATGLSSQLLDGVPAIAEAQLVIVCRKLYRQDMDPACFTDPQPDTAHYPAKDYHRIYVGEIEKVYLKE